MKRREEACTASRDGYEQAFAVRQLLVIIIPVIAIFAQTQIQSWKLLFILVFFSGSCNLTYYLLALRGRFLPRLKWIQITVDVLLWTALISISGGIHSIFYLGYLLEILVCSITLSTRGCVYAGILSGSSYGILINQIQSGGIISDLVPKLLFLGAVCFLSVVVIGRMEKKNKEVLSLNARLRRRVEAADEELKNIIASMSSGLIAIDDRDGIIEFNMAAEELTGLQRRDILGRDVKQVFPGEPGLALILLNESAAHQGMQRITISYATGANNRILEIHPFAPGFSHRAKAAALIYDISAIEEMREESIRTRALSALGTMVASVMHDVRNPLHGIKGFLYLLKNSGDADRNEQLTLIRNLEQGIIDLESILNDLLFYAGVTNIDRTPVDLRHLVESAIKFLPPAAADYTIVRHIGAVPVLIDVDAFKMRRCILNLLLNALDFTAPGGTITISISSVNGSASLAIKDTGCGIAEDIRESIFNPFFSTKRQGTGLGLAIVRSIVELHKGDIVFESAAGRGSEFIVRLPTIAEIGGLAAVNL